MKPKAKPISLIFYEMTVELGIPLVDGGIMDQPYIWLQMIGVIKHRESLWRTLTENAKSPPNPT